jgi:environmental stress-induced protein Ves
MRVTRLEPSHYLLTPWKNGLGTTAEIARAPRDGEAFDWRISVAQVTADGPFSPFPGCDRVIVALEGPGMILTHEEVGTEVAVGSLEPWAFSGDWTTNCALRGDAIRDFNVITRREACSAVVSVINVNLPRVIELTAATTVLYCVDGRLSVDTPSPIELTRDQTVILERTADEDEGLAIHSTLPGSVLIQVQLFSA